MPVWPKSWSLLEPPVRVSLLAPPNRFARGSAPLTSLRLRESLPPWPKARISAVLATVGVPPTTAMAPLFTRILPAAFRLMAIELPAASPVTVSTPLANVAVVAALAGGLAAKAAAIPRARASSGRVARRLPSIRLAFSM